jgi:hypothetical protein
MVNSKKRGHNMKKLLTLTMVLALSVAFTAGCKKKTEEATPATPAAPAAEAPKPVQAPMSAKAPAAPAPEAPKAPEKK